MLLPSVTNLVLEGGFIVNGERMVAAGRLHLEAVDVLVDVVRNLHAVSEGVCARHSVMTLDSFIVLKIE